MKCSSGLPPALLRLALATPSLTQLTYDRPDAAEGIHVGGDGRRASEYLSGGDSRARFFIHLIEGF